MTNTIRYDSFFSTKTTDNNGRECCDVNAGLKRLYQALNDNWYSFGEVQRYLVSEDEDGFPELVARHSVLGSQDYWWWILFLNRLDDPLTAIKENWIYSINSRAQISSFITETNITENKVESDIGKKIKIV